MSKEKISSNYIEEQKIKHGWKKYPSPYYTRKIAITGASRQGSIGENIIDSMPEMKFDKFNDNVYYSDFKFDNHTDLVMCHGTTSLNWIENTQELVSENIVNTNLVGSIRVITQFVRQTIDSPHRKKIIAIGSMAYNHVLNGSAAYCASKAGLNMYIKCAAWELAPKGYDVYIIHPSNVVDAPMSEDTIVGLMRYRGLTRDEAEQYWSASCPRESFLTKGEISDLVRHLLTVDRGYLSGAPLELGGGQR